MIASSSLQWTNKMIKITQLTKYLATPWFTNILLPMSIKKVEISTGISLHHESSQDYGVGSTEQSG